MIASYSQGESECRSLARVDELCGDHREVGDATCLRSPSEAGDGSTVRSPSEGARELGDDDHLPLAGFDGLNDVAAEEAGIGANRDLTDVCGDLGKAGRQQGQTHSPRQTASGGMGHPPTLGGKNWELRAAEPIRGGGRTGA